MSDRSKKIIFENKHHKSSKQKNNTILCKKNCCPEEKIVDCCTPAFLRLNELRSTWSNIICTANNNLPTTSNNNYITNIFNNDGNPILVPTKNIFQNTDNNGIALATSINNYIYSIDLSLAYYAYVFVNTLRYSVFLECGKRDQLYGWLFDTSTKNLEIFHNINDLGLTPSVNRLTLIQLPENKLTKIQKKQLNGLNILYKLSKKALSKITLGKNDGSIVSIKEKNDQVWTIAINTASRVSNILKPTQYVIVAISTC